MEGLPLEPLTLLLGSCCGGREFRQRLILSIQAGKLGRVGLVLRRVKRELKICGKMLRSPCGLIVATAKRWSLPPSFRRKQWTLGVLSFA